MESEFENDKPYLNEPHFSGVKKSFIWLPLEAAAVEKRLDIK